MKIAAVTGGIGDIVYSIPILRKIDVGRIYVKEDFYPDGSSKYSVMKRLLMSQGFDSHPIPGGTDIGVFPPDLQYDVNLDGWRSMPGRNRIHIIRNMMLYYRCFDRNWNAPFLRDIPVSNEGHDLIFLSPRWRENSRINWNRVVHIYGLRDARFIGLEEDWKDFVMNYGAIKFQPTTDMYEMAQLIASCNRLFTNQSVALTLAQGLGKEYWLEVKPGKANTLFCTPNEHILK